MAIQETTLAQHFARWNARRLGLKKITPSTAETYERALAALLARHGSAQLSAITGDLIEDFYIERLRVVSGATLRNTHVTLCALFASAVDAGLIAASPMARVETPEGRSGERNALEAHHIRALLAHAQDRPLLRLVVRLALATGMRRGELAALRWSDIDLAAGVIHVTRGLVRVGRSQKETQTKGGEGRAVSLPADLLAELRAIAGQADAHVLRTNRGDAPTLAYLSEIVKDALRAIGLDKGFCLHSTRHAHATHLLAAHMPLKAVSQRLGHADVTVTMRVYAKVMSGDDAACAAAINAVMAA